MKQTMKSKAGSKRSISTGESVSANKGTSRKSGFIRCAKTILKLRFMNQHENDLFTGPLTVSGFNWGSFCKMNLPVSDKMPVKSDVKNQPRIKSDTAIGFSVFGYMFEGVVKSGKYKNTLKTYAENRDLSCKENNLPGAPECVDATEFRRQSDWLADYPEKSGDIPLNAIIRSFMQFEEVACIYLCKSDQMQCEAVKTRFGMITSKHNDKQKAVKNPFRWRKTVHSEQLVELSERWKNCDDAGAELCCRINNN